MARAGASPKKKAQTNRADAGAQLRARKDKAVEVVADPLLGEGAGREIFGVLVAVAAVVSCICVVAPSSAPVAAIISDFYRLGFGLGAYVVPLVLLAASALVFLPARVHIPVRAWFGGALIFVAVLAILCLVAPGVSYKVTLMFDPSVLVASGGWTGALIASALQTAFGTTISVVIAIGLVILGFVVIGFSISQVVEAILNRFGSRHTGFKNEAERADVNQRPWGAERAPLVGAPDESFGATTYLGDRKITVLADDEADDPHENPLIDGGARTAADTAPTTLIPVPDRFVTSPHEEPEAPQLDSASDALDSDAAPSETKQKRRGSKHAAKAASSAEATKETGKAVEPHAQPVLDARTGTQRPIPEFLAVSKQPDDHASAQDHKTTLCDDPSDSEDETRQLPPSSMLRHNPASASSTSSARELEQTAASLQSTLQEFGLRSAVVGWIAGPTVTTFKIQPGEGERVSRINSLEDDIALTLATDSVRIFAPIPGTSLVGIEIPNRTRQTVAFGDILPYVTGGSLEFALGRDAEGAPMVADLAKMPHLLIAGTTGSGKSVVISSIVMSLLMRTFPEDVRLIMIDPKRVEFAPYDGLPHLYVPVVTEPKQAASALQWAVTEMERRLKIFERIGVRKIATFNEKQAAGEFDHYDNPPAKMPYLVIVIDELSDLMMVAGKDVEASIVRIAQLGRAAGIHMIVATQRPSSNVVTGLIKANITNRIGLTVATGIDSRVILDQTGAEKLTGQGDMLFSRVDWGKPKRIQGCYVSDEEIVSVVSFVKEHSSAEYHEEILSAAAPASVVGGAGDNSTVDDDPLLWDAARIVVDSQLGSTSGLQRRLKVGYARAGRIMDMLEEKRIVGPPDGSKPREVLLDMDELKELEARLSPLVEDEYGGGLG
ncbi:DNA translocase FtsK [Collinsella sp. AGMB00827]|uniref:DNA translocase FtsK n=1 Tax=Collinsella ureilytica TaxID=2869515 RepID=A0ABS7MKT9_9ACTN|nr:DNA translocase FtsK [Collinsella urealyticum]MBY4797982.1 DNA translocase FtsK [Collinsella urealyticum]